MAPRNLVTDLRKQLKAIPAEKPESGYAVIPVEGSTLAYLAQFQDNSLWGCVAIRKDLAADLAAQLVAWGETA